MKYNDHGNFFSLLNKIFLLGLRPGELAVYSYLRRCEDRATHQCWPSYKTIGKAVGMSENTVRKYTLRLEERGPLSTEPTEVVTATGQKRNGNLRYTLRPVQEWIAAHYDRQLEQLEMAATRQRAAAMQGNRGSL
ncbi:MAG: helix-turn-helix domain-containing protein [Oscillospiraceae bacterium]